MSCAYKQGNYDIVQLLLQQPGIDVNVITFPFSKEENYPPIPAEKAKAPISALHIVLDSAPSKLINRGYSPVFPLLMYSKFDRESYENIALLLVEQGADFKIQDTCDTLRVPMYIALQKGFYKFCQLLVQKGALVNYFEENFDREIKSSPYSLLHIACSQVELFHIVFF